MSAVRLSMSQPRALLYGAIYAVAVVAVGLLILGAGL